MGTYDTRGGAPLHDKSADGSDERGPFYVEHDGERFEFGNLRTALDYFAGCVRDEGIGTAIRFIDHDGERCVGVFDWDGLEAPRS